MSPARRRTVISRAYYAAFHFLSISPVGSAFVRDRAAEFGIHAQFIRYLTASADLKTKLAGRKLEGLYGRRIAADYYLGTDISYNMAREAVEDAQEIVEEIFSEEEWAEEFSKNA